VDNHRYLSMGYGRWQGLMFWVWSCAWRADRVITRLFAVPVTLGIIGWMTNAATALLEYRPGGALLAEVMTS
jgi:hypothetical protein